MPIQLAPLILRCPSGSCGYSIPLNKFEHSCFKRAGADVEYFSQLLLDAHCPMCHEQMEEAEIQGNMCGTCRHWAPNSYINIQACWRRKGHEAEGKVGAPAHDGCENWEVDDGQV